MTTYLVVPASAAAFLVPIFLALSRIVSRSSGEKSLLFFVVRCVVFCGVVFCGAGFFCVSSCCVSSCGTVACCEATTCSSGVAFFFIVSLLILLLFNPSFSIHRLITFGLILYSWAALKTPTILTRDRISSRDASLFSR